MPDTTTELVAPLSARSVALSLLLGTHPPSLSTAELTRLGEHFGVSPGTMRVAISRMTATGDLVDTDGLHVLSPRLVARQHATDIAIRPRLLPYDGTWRMVVITGRGRPAAERTGLRTALTTGRFAELREGVWLRPDNLASVDPTTSGSASDAPHIPPPMLSTTDLDVFTTRPGDDHALCRRLWDLDDRADTARRLCDVLAGDRPPADRLAAAAGAVRHLATDPVLPVELAPDDWPTDALRNAYDEFRTGLEATYLAHARPTTPEEYR